MHHPPNLKTSSIDSNPVYFYSVLPTNFSEEPKYFCMPIGATVGQLQKVYIKYANENPQALHYDAAGMVRKAFTEAFPCK
jgi:hypothetical protein